MIPAGYHGGGGGGGGEGWDVSVGLASCSAMS